MTGNSYEDNGIYRQGAAISSMCHRYGVHRHYERLAWQRSSGYVYVWRYPYRPAARCVQHRGAYPPRKPSRQRAIYAPRRVRVRAIGINV